MIQRFEEMDLDGLSSSREFLISDCRNLIEKHPDLGLRKTKSEIDTCQIEIDQLELEMKSIISEMDKSKDLDRIRLLGEQRYNLAVLAYDLLDTKASLIELLETYGAFVQSIRLISITPANRDKIASELSVYLPGQENKLMSVLNKHSQTNIVDIIIEYQKPDELIKFHGNQKTLVVLFRKFKKNGWINASQGNLKQWLCKHFIYYFDRGKIHEYRPLSEKTVWDYLTKEEYTPK